MNAPSFQHIAPPLRLYSGGDVLKHLGRELDRLKCRRAVIFCGNSLAREGKLLAEIQAALGERCAGVFSGVRGHSPVSAVQTAADELKRLDADAVIAVGGGSAIVTARAASILLAETGTARSLATYRDEKGDLKSPKLLAAKLPQFILPTTPTTATVKAGSALFDTETGDRLALFDPKTRAHAVFVHPGLISSAPHDLIVSASLNTLTMAIEGLMSHTGDPYSDALMIHALRLVVNALPQADLSERLDLRADLIHSALLCGQASDYTGAGITTVLGHAIGARFDVENGLSNAIVLPYAIRFNAEAAATGLGKIATALALPADMDASAVAGKVIATLDQTFTALQIPRRLRDIGVPQEALPDIAQGAMGDWFLRGNPRPVKGASELEQVLNAAW